jgi:hypothetical protein
MSDGNGHLARRVTDAEADAQGLRKLVMSEFRALREDFKAQGADIKNLAEQCRRTGEAVDTILRILQLQEEASGE